MTRFRRGIMGLGGAVLAALLLVWLGEVVMARRGMEAGDVSQAVGSYVGQSAPGLQYVVVDAEGTLFDWAGGWARIADGIEMTGETTLMAYSMTKTLTAVAVLQLVERGLVDLDAPLDDLLQDTPYGGRGITTRQLLAHTSGIPNPIPLRWAHLSSESAAFDEDAALQRVLARHPRLASTPGATFRYSNIGYWLLGKVIERASGRPYEDYVRDEVLTPLRISGGTGFAISDARHASGYLARRSFLNLAKGFLMERKFWSGYEGRWLRFESHHLNGPSFGGLIGSAGDFARFLQDQLQPRSVLLGPEGRRLLESRQNDAGGPIDMTLGWHVGRSNGVRYLFKEGGGGGFHSEMRLYPDLGIATVVMVNGTEFDSSAFLNRVDPAFHGRARSGPRVDIQAPPLSHVVTTSPAAPASDHLAPHDRAGAGGHLR